MKELLDFVSEHNFLKMGDYHFSPIMVSSSGICLEYCKKINESKCEKSPLFLCFPEKKSASLWTSVTILMNYFFEDYVNNAVLPIKFNKGDKVKIFNCIAQVERTSKEIVFLKFRDQGGIPINKKLRQQLSKVKKTRSLSLKRKFSTNYFINKKNRNAISKILVPNDPETINTNTIHSKVLLVAGRGNVKKFQESLNKIKIYEETLSKIFGYSKNLIIKPDLRDYKDFFNSKKLIKLEEFKAFLNRFYEIIEIEEARSELNIIISKLNHEEGISFELDKNILDFFQTYENDIPKLKFLEEKYPGYQESLPINLRAVIINDISQIIDYRNTINGFISKGIPVIIVSNRNLKENWELDFFERLFKKNPNYYRINWNKNKINKLISCENYENYLDNDLWKQCKRYNEQLINIKVVGENDLDIMSLKVINHIKQLNEFEKLQKAFYNYFYPALYLLKNSLTNHEKVKELVKEFNLVFLDDKTYLSKEITQDFEKTISLVLHFETNTKQFEMSEDVFSSILFNSNNSKIYIPLQADKISLPSDHKDKIIFTGYPFSEYSNKYLLDSVSINYIPEIEIICWPLEARLTKSYLNRRIKAGYFTDFLGNIIQIKNKYLIRNSEFFQNEIDSYLLINKKFEHDNSLENDIEYLHKFKYKGFENSYDVSNSFTVKCDILNFDDGCFMFLPKGSKILAQTEDNQGMLKVSKKSHRELNIGDKIFKYISDRHTLREISKSNQLVLNQIEKLEYWKEALNNIYLKNDNNLKRTELSLKKVKTQFNLGQANPTIENLKNWLYDDEFLKPETENLLMILYANEEPNVEQKIIELDKAFKHVFSYSIGLSSNIKKKIANYISSNNPKENEFVITIGGNKLVVQSRSIISLEKENMKIDYHNTRKIIC